MAEKTKSHRTKRRGHKITQLFIALDGLAKNEDETLFKIVRPILIIPGAKNQQSIIDWEEQNKIYRKEVGLLFRHLKKIKKQEYFSALSS